MKDKIENTVITTCYLSRSMLSGSYYKTTLVSSHTRIQKTAMYSVPLQGGLMRIEGQAFIFKRQQVNNNSGT